MTATRRRNKVGAMRHLVTLQQRDETQVPNSRGHIEPNWVNVLADIPAEVMKLSGRDAELARQMNADCTHRVRIRHRPGVVEQMRFKFGERFLYIGDIDDTHESGHWLRCLCSEKR